MVASVRASPGGCAAPAAASRAGRRDHERDQRREHGQHDEDAAPRRQLQHLAADERREDRRRPVTSISEENSRTAAAPVWRSRTMARAMTTPPAPASPCTSRSPISTGDARRQRAQQRGHGVGAHRRDQRQPAADAVAQRPDDQLAERQAGDARGQRELDLRRARAERRAISGKAGRYMSIDSGPIALTAPEHDDELERGGAAARARALLLDRGGHRVSRGAGARIGEPVCPPCRRPTPASPRACRR